MKRFLMAGIIAAAATVAQAQEAVTYTTEDSFDDVIFGLENAILDEGLVIDHVSHTGDMLERTKGDLDAEMTIYDMADIYSFCSAALSREVMEADPMNVQFCPYNIFVAQRPGEQVMIGYRPFPEGEMQKIQALLDGIVRNAIGLD
ncbi:DUF302 domain-containing protein [Lutimaribacter sp. EGI FJ00015]|uniref:DUF302 domain-containing protein n=1 Tax=Lutimaribacter degradans TaxID=2945989 RepID=A0ACC5ZXC5_9RHOB|nr:DUF302 domain-containing protein [Lutimaribacter sp. EGI FJ00013]MCM2562726.1 DUF302 domain-containing protein [Lutimaribacter sp. EGI FJ00013]MCO0613883.1 DUF302 domain-containing protein [Lutimaribacter sp. EGI FJ00015]MCO0636855.1 DUF302 domain-containing protein [Lutimaribacter sp. EGI FJ00014]